MNGEEIRIVLEKHEKWLNNELGGIRADLREAALYGLDLNGANLWGANLIKADLRVAYLIKADLREATLRVANLSGADLSGADLYGVNLRGADLRGANLRWAKNVPSYACRLVCPEEGSFIGFKKADTTVPDSREAIVKLLITEDAKRSSATTRKCRCDKAKVISITSLDGKENFTTAYSYYDRFFQYTVGQTVIVDDFDEDRWNECSTGVHFFITREEAIDYAIW